MTAIEDTALVAFIGEPSADEHFRIQLTDAAGTAQSVACDFTPFLTEDDYEDLRWYLEDYMDLPDGGAVVRANRIEQQLDQWGRRLHDALFSAPENRALLDQLLDSPEPRRLTIAPDESALLRLPWELLAGDAGSLAQRVSVRRQSQRLRPCRGAGPAARGQARPARLAGQMGVWSRPAGAPAGIRDSRFTVVAGSQAALDSKWVAWEIDKHQELNLEGDRLIPIKLEPLELFQQRDLLMVWDNFESALPQFNTGANAPSPHPDPVPEGEGDLERATRDFHPNDGASPYTDEERVRLADLFHDLTTGPGRGCLLVTCRPEETGLPGAQRQELQGLARPDSLWLLHRILERDGLSLSDPRLTKERLEPLLRDLADHPLSLELVGPHLRSLTPEAIRADFGKLLDRFKQDADQGCNQSLLASLEFSRRHLSPAARAALPLARPVQRRRS